MLIFLLFAGTGLLLAGLGVPLMRRRVPRNHLYGLRTQATLASDRVWYEANERGGRQLVAIGLLQVAVAGVLYLVKAQESSAGLVNAGFITVAVLFSCVDGIRHARRLQAKPD